MVRLLRLAERGQHVARLLPVRAETLTTGAYGEEREPVATSLQTSRALLGVREIPLVEHDDRSGAGGVDALGESLVLVRHPGGGVDDEQGGVGAVDRLERTHEPVVLGWLVDPAPAAHAGGVDEPERTVLRLDHRVDRVACRAGLVVHDGALVADEPVEQRGLPDVRPADDRHRERSLRRFGLGLTSGRSSGAAGGNAATTASSRSPLPRPCSADTACGSPRPSRVNAHTSTLA